MKKIYLSITAIAISTIVSTSYADVIQIGGTGMTLGLVKALKAPFEKQYPNDQLMITPGMGSGGGIAALADSALDIAISGRHLKDREKAKGLKIRPFIETPFVFVGNAPKALNFSIQELVDIFSGKKTTLTDGLRTRLILRPEGDSVTKFLEKEIDGMKAALVKARAIPGVPIAQTDQENMKLAQNMAGAVTAMTMAQVRTEPNSLKLVKIDGFDAEKSIIGEGTYPFKTNAWIVTREKISPVVQRFLDFLNTPSALSVYKNSGSRKSSK